MCGVVWRRVLFGVLEVVGLIADVTGREAPISPSMTDPGSRLADRGPPSRGFVRWGYLLGVCGNEGFVRGLGWLVFAGPAQCLVACFMLYALSPSLVRCLLLGVSVALKSRSCFLWRAAHGFRWVHRKSVLRFKIGQIPRSASRRRRKPQWARDG